MVRWTIVRTRMPPAAMVGGVCTPRVSVRMGTVRMSVRQRWEWRRRGDWERGDRHRSTSGRQRGDRGKWGNPFVGMDDVLGGARSMMVVYGAVLMALGVQVVVVVEVVGVFWWWRHDVS